MSRAVAIVAGVAAGLLFAPVTGVAACSEGPEGGSCHERYFTFWGFELPHGPWVGLLPLCAGLVAGVAVAVLLRRHTPKGG
ncbi:MAG: hypothetical protein ACRDPK_00900 [Carbonactinosporaceae bacterium]